MTATEPIDANPPYYFPDYRITEHRSPRDNVVILPDWYRSLPGPSWSRIPVGPSEDNLNEQRSGQPLGQRLILFGKLLDPEGCPVPGALIELWQANGAGRYDDPADPAFFPLDPNFVGSGRCVTDDEGNYRFLTIRPAAYPGKRGGLYRPSHIHLSIFAEDLCSRLVTQCYFPDDPLLSRDPIVNAIGEAGIRQLTASFVGEMTEPNGEDSALAYRYDIILRGSRQAANSNGFTVAPPVAMSPSQTIGPLYGFALMFPGSQVGADPDDPRATTVSGTIYDGQGEPVPWPDAMIEVWHGDQFARARTDTDGRYSVTLLRPVFRPHGEREEAPHFEVTIFARGLLKQAQTRMYFPDEKHYNATDPVLQQVDPSLRRRLLATEDGSGHTFNIHLQGPDETVFFEL